MRTVSHSPLRLQMAVVFLVVAVAALTVLVTGVARAAEPCPKALRFDADGPATDIDLGWTGMAHDNHFVGLTLTMGVSGCPGTTPPCGTCTLSGPVANGGGATFNNRRCVDKTWLTCVDDADCVSQGAAGPCHVFFGPPLPYTAGGVSVCITNEITGALTGGSTDVEAGTVAMTLPYLLRIYAGPTQNRPCPQCIAGFCDDGLRVNQPCTTSGTSPVFGDVSFDCPPNPGNAIGDLVPSGLALSTSDQTMTLGAASPNCQRFGFTGLKCFCDTCNNANAEACSSNADCPDPPGPIGPICGGRRCLFGSNSGAPCSATSECPGGGFCGVPGEASAPNKCADAICSPNTSDTDSTNEGACTTMGPFETFCGPWATFQACSIDADCAAFNRCVGGTNDGALGCTNNSACPGGTCELQVCGATPATAHFRECFTDNGLIGASIEAGGVANPPVGNTASATLGSLFCIKPSASDSVNIVGGFPGPGRFTLPGTLTFADEIVSGTVGGGGSVTTDTEGDGATPADPLETAVTSPNSGEIIINEQADSGLPPPGFGLLGKRVNITAPPATAADPLVLVFRIDATRIPAGEDETSIQVFKDPSASPIPGCTGTGATPNPCISQRTLLGDGDVEITVKTATASLWRFGTAAFGDLDHFTCYKAGATSGSIKFAGVAGLPLTDQFGSSIVEVKKPKFLCAPTDKNGEDPTAPAHPEHLKGYQIKNPLKPVLPTNLTVIDQFNRAGLFIDAKKQSHLLVPTVKSLSAPPLLPGAFAVDHFQCYKAKTSKGAPKFVPVLNVEIEDQFGIMHVDVKKPKYLCNPVDKNGEGILDPVTHLMCYQVKQVKTEPKFPEVVGVFVNNQFGPEQLDVKKPSELCVPALKNL